MSTLLFTHAACLEHDTGPHHPERPARLQAAVAGARASGLVASEHEAPQATLDHLALVHDPAYVAAIDEFCRAGGGSLDADTTAVAASWDAALRAAGAGIAAADAIRSGEATSAFLAVRPPGHHALTARAMGFCLFNNAAVLAAYLTQQGERVAIVDWDVHHGNGTQDTFAGDDEVLYVSLHQFPFYPGTGWIDEVGTGDARGSTVNIPLPSGTRGDAVEAAFRRIVMPVVSQFDPTWLIVSAGYDAHRADPLAELSLEADDYGRMASHLAATELPTVVFLEGGYDLAAIEASVSATLQGLDGSDFEHSEGSPEEAFELVEAAAKVASLRWDAVDTDG